MSIKEREHKSHTETKDEIMNSGEGSTKASSTFNVKIENQRKCDAQNLEETSTNTSSRSSFVDSTSVSSSVSTSKSKVNNSCPESYSCNMGIGSLCELTVISSTGKSNTKTHHPCSLRSCK